MDPGGGLVPAEFWGTTVPARKSVAVGRFPEEDDQTLDTYHLSQVALGPEPAPGRHVVFVEYEGSKSVIGTLTLGGVEQFQIDFPVNCEVKLSHSGKSDVFVTGYTTRQFLGYDDSDSSDDEGAEEESSGEEAERAWAAAAAANPLANGKSTGKQRLAALQPDSDSEEGDEEEGSVEESDSDEEAAAGGRLQTHQFSDMDDDSEEGESSDEGEALDVDAEEGSDVEDDDEESEEEEEEVPAAAPKGAKRVAATAATPQQQKKAKTAATPGSAAAASPGTANGLETYQAAIQKYLKANGATTLAQLGSQVKRAPGLPKMKKFLEDRPSLFKLDVESGVVSLA